MEFHDAKYLYLQDGPEEEIPPMGNVLAIHDKRNRLLWSRMHYGVSFRGDTTQKKYKGKNLMNYNVYNADNSRVMYMPNLVLPAGTYTISFDLESFNLGTNTSMSVYMSLYNSGGTNVTGDNNILTINSSTSLSRYFFTFTASDEVHGNSSQIRLTSTAYSANGRCKLSNIQIEDGSLATTYEPYVGGIPAPNPYYPQAINVVTGVQSVWVHGKNLFDKSVVPGSISSNMSTGQLPTGIRATNDDVTGHSAIHVAFFKVCDLSKIVGETITVKVNISSSSVNRPRAIIGFSRANFGNRTTKIQLDASGSDSFVVDGVQSDQTILFLGLYAALGTTSGDAPSGSYVDYTDLQIEIGDQVTSYEAFVPPQTYTIDLGSTEFCKLSYEMGSYEDVIYENEGDWYILKSIGKVDLADQTWGEASSQLKSTTTIPNIKYVLSSSQVGIGLAEKYVMRRASGMATAVNYIAIDTGAVRVNTGDASITPTGLFYYVLEDAVLTKITDPTLLSWLNSVWSWLNRYGYDFTVTGNLPIVVFRSEL